MGEKKLNCERHKSYEALAKDKKIVFEEALYSFYDRVDGFAHRVYEAMQYSLKAGGKRIRPLLFLEAYSQVRGEIEQSAMSFACAIEMIHTYSLVHDDLPAMDDDDYRRGKPTNHKVFGEGMAILAGDGLLNGAYELMLNASLSAKNPKAALKAAMHIANASGVNGMIGGQVVDMESEGKGLVGSAAESTLAYIHAHKTAALLETSVYAGACLAEATDEHLKALETYGHHIGMAFQIVDDILDIVGDQALLGKDIGSDIERGKLTYPALYGIDKSRLLAKQHLDAAKNALIVFDQPSELLLALVDFLMDRNY